MSGIQQVIAIGPVPVFPCAAIEDGRKEEAYRRRDPMGLLNHVKEVA